MITPARNVASPPTASAISCLRLTTSFLCPKVESQVRTTFRHSAGSAIDQRGQRFPVRSELLKGLRCAAPAFAPTPPPPAGVRSGCLASGLHSWHVPQAGARRAKAALLSPAAVCGERVPVQAQSPACPLGAERMWSSIQFALGWSRVGSSYLAGPPKS